MSLYQMGIEFKQVIQTYDEAENFEDDAIANQLTAIMAEGNQSASGLVALVRSIEAEQDARKVEIARLQAMNKRAEKFELGVRKFILGWLRLTGQPKVKTTLGTFSIRKASTSIVVDERKVTEWPADVYDEAVAEGVLTEIVKVNKTELKRVFPEIYTTLPGVAELEGEESLTIR